MIEMVVIVDYGVGNLGSIVNMLKRIGVAPVVSSNPENVRQADRLILPGVGAFSYGMQKLNEHGLVDVLHQKVVVEHIPILGICLGLQLFTKRSDEGDADGLGWIDGETVRFRWDACQAGLNVPHMGWNDVCVQRPNRLLDGINGERRFYFAHSYHVRCRSDDIVVGKTNYGYEFASVIVQDNLMGVQFHPEKSHRYGMALLAAFVHQ